MDGFDIMAHLGINQGQNDKLIPRPPDNSPNPPNNSPKLPYNSPKENSKPEPITAKIGALGEKVSEKPPVKESLLFDDEEYRQSPTLPHSEYEPGETGWDDLPAPSPPSLNRGITETELTFFKKSLAVQWHDYLTIVCGASTWKITKQRRFAQTVWVFKITGLSVEQSHSILDADRKQPPPNQPIYKR